jgi:hypothetical protein
MPARRIAVDDHQTPPPARQTPSLSSVRKCIQDGLRFLTHQSPVKTAMRAVDGCLCCCRWASVAVIVSSTIRGHNMIGAQSIVTTADKAWCQVWPSHIHISLRTLLDRVVQSALYSIYGDVIANKQRKTNIHSLTLRRRAQTGHVSISQPVFDIDLA